jgi:hypothetical protein
VAYIVGVEKNFNEMFADLDTLLAGEGWEKLEEGTCGSLTTSRGIVLTGSCSTRPGKYSDTIGLRLNPDNYFTSTNYTKAELDAAYFTQYPTEFSISMWIKMDDCLLDTASTYYPTKVIDGPYNTAALRMGPRLGFGKDAAITVNERWLETFTRCMDDYFADKTGRDWELLTFTYSTTDSEVKFYINGTYINSHSIESTYTHYGILYQIHGSTTTTSYDEIIVWDKVLTETEITALSLKTTKVLPSDANVFEHYTYNVGAYPGGYYSNTTTNGSKITIYIGMNSSNNIELKSPLYTMDTTVFGTTENVTTTAGLESTKKYLAGVSPISTTLKKYWLVVSQDRVCISYKLHDETAIRSTPLYQTGYIGKITALGNDGNAVFTAGTTTTSTYLWTSINTSFRSGLMYSSNNSYRLGYSGYVNSTVGSINTQLSGLTSISNTTYMAAVNISYNSHAIGIATGVYVVASSQASVEDIITIGANDYVVLADGDVSVGNHYFAIKLS